MDKPPRHSRLRFSLRWLFAVVTVAAIGSAALATPTELWVSVVFSGTLLILVAALLVAIVGRRFGATGFVLCGAAYLALILAPGADTNIVPHLVTGKILVDLERWWHIDPTSMWASVLITNGPTWANHFQRIGHCLFALLFAAVGSVTALWLGETRVPSTTATSKSE